MRERSGSVIRLSLPLRAAAQRFALPSLIFLSVTLLVLGKADIVLFDRVRTVVADAMTPILDAIARPLSTVANAASSLEHLFEVYSENARLRDENATLMQWQEVARRLEAENSQLRGLLNFTPPDLHGYITSRVIGNSGGAFLRNVMVDTGSRDGVERGQAAITGTGIVGRVIEVGDRASRVLLLTDLNSRIPVVLDGSRERAVLAGDNSNQPHLLYLPAKSAVKIGDRIVTSGSGGIFPPGLPVGTVASIENGVAQVEPYAELARLEYVRIVDFGLSGVLPQSAVPAPKAGKGARRGADAAPDAR